MCDLPNFYMSMIAGKAAPEVFHPGTAHLRHLRKCHDPSEKLISRSPYNPYPRSLSLTLLSEHPL